MLTQVPHPARLEALPDPLSVQIQRHTRVAARPDSTSVQIQPPRRKSFWGGGESGEEVILGKR